MASFVAATVAGTLEISELNITLTTTPVDLATDFSLSDIWDARSLLDAIEAGTVIVGPATGIGWNLADKSDVTSASPTQNHIVAGLDVIGETPATVVNSALNNMPLPSSGAIELAAVGNRDLSGIQAPATSRSILIINTGSGRIKLKNEASASQAANRFRMPGSKDVNIQSFGVAQLVYVVSLQRWILTGIV